MKVRLSIDPGDLKKKERKKRRKKKLSRRSDSAPGVELLGVGELAGVVHSDGVALGGLLRARLRPDQRLRHQLRGVGRALLVGAWASLGLVLGVKHLVGHLDQLHLELQGGPCRVGSNILRQHQLELQHGSDVSTVVWKIVDMH